MTDKKAKIMNTYAMHSFEDSSDLYSDKHFMTNKELCGQVEMFAGNIQRYYLPIDTPIHISVLSVPSNGARLVVRLLNSNEHIGYAKTLYAISRRLNLISQICDLFEKDPDILSDSDFYSYKLCV